MKGKIIKLTGGFYYVNSESEVYETRARGNFRNNDIKPLVGDIVEFKYDENKLGYIEKVYPRKNKLLRPAVANVDQVLIVIPTKDPKYNLNLIDKMICFYENKVDILIAINKYDLDRDKAEELMEIYRKAGFKTFLISYKYTFTIDLLREYLKQKTTALCGVSAAGKSTIASNILKKDILIGDVSEKTKRGKHTTRHTEIFTGDNNTYIFDTPGFSSFDLDINSEELQQFFREFKRNSGKCKFNNCKHINEPECNIKKMVENGLISKSRYDSYLEIYNELKEKERYF
ncbi:MULTISPECIES: ribosome small subunit-dependent GTPase A [Peptoniphilus]|uniref:ribosome small subunit-dependent GTPase A n=1 Tax=Peptoniphilus TaxID=162289 RepID=UPI0001DA9C0D|nr:MULTISPECIES: ribosome small subunit-dependent GTPase A [Peptoniphilus]EFI42202.1 ribosome small subunit-dependent GTPase A [Peptoniphilus sp. oral taxon 386 str. F0131]